MISIKISHGGLAQNLSTIAKPAKVQTIRKQLANGKEREALLKDLSIKQTEWVKKLVTQQKAGWANDPILKKKVLVEKGTGIRYLALDGQIISQPDYIKFPSVKFDFDTFMKNTKGHENDVEVMYLDSMGKVTVGRGHLVKGEDGAVSLNKGILPFFRKSDDKKASDDEVKAEYRHVAQLEKNKVGNYYRDRTHLYVRPTDIPKLAEKDALIHIAEIETVLDFDEFSTYPSTVQLALADMQFNMGSTNFKTEFPKFTMAIKHRDWLTAAKESSRKQVSKKRNKDIKFLILGGLGNPEYFISTSEMAQSIQYQFLWNGGYTLTKAKSI